MIAKINGKQCEVIKKWLIKSNLNSQGDKIETNSLLHKYMTSVRYPVENTLIPGP